MTVDDIINGIEEQYGVLMAQEGADVQALTKERAKVVASLRKHAAVLDKRGERRAEEIAAGEILSIAHLASRPTNPTRLAINLERLRDTLDRADSPEGLGQGPMRMRRPRPDR